MNHCTLKTLKKTNRLLSLIACVLLLHIAYPDKRPRKIIKVVVFGEDHHDQTNG